MLDHATSYILRGNPAINLSGKRFSGWHVISGKAKFKFLRY